MLIELAVETLEDLIITIEKTFRCTASSSVKSHHAVKSLLTDDDAVHRNVFSTVIIRSKSFPLVSPLRTQLTMRWYQQGRPARSPVMHCLRDSPSHCGIGVFHVPFARQTVVWQVGNMYPVGQSCKVAVNWSSAPSLYTKFQPIISVQVRPEWEEQTSGGSDRIKEAYFNVLCQEVQTCDNRNGALSLDLNSAVRSHKPGSVLITSKPT